MRRNRLVNQAPTVGKRARETSQRNALARKARLAAARLLGTHTNEQWQQLVDACGRRCVRCGVGGVTLARDHIVPLHQKGSDAIANIQPLCGGCNSAKGGDCTDYRPERVRSAMGCA